MTAQSGVPGAEVAFDAEAHAEMLRAQAGAGAPHAIPIWQLLGRGVSILTLPANGLPFSRLPGLSSVTILRDEVREGVRYDGFDPDSVERLLAGTDVWAIMVPPVHADAYAAVLQCASERGCNCVIVETTPAHECAWFDHLAAFAPDAGKLWASARVGGIWHARPTPRLPQ